jgi:hypothetical protein
VGPWTFGRGAEEGTASNFWSDYARRAAGGHICGVALIRVPGARYSGPGSLLSSEHRLLKDWCVDPSSKLVYFEVLDAFAIGNFAGGGDGLPSDSVDLLPVIWDMRKRRLVTTTRAAVGSLSSTTSLAPILGATCFRASHRDSDPQPTGTLREVLGQWRDNHSTRGWPADPDRPVDVCWFLWHPLAALVLHRRWHTLVSYEGGCPVQLVPPCRPLQLPGSCIDIVGEGLTVATATLLADSLRQWAPVLQESADANDACTAQFLQGFMEWADRLVDSLVSIRCGGCSTARSVGVGGAKYELVWLVQCMLVANFLRSDAVMTDVIRGVMLGMLPPMLAAGFTHLAAGVTFCPHRTLLSHYRLSFDAAFCMLWGDIYGQLPVGTPLYLQADSSPQFRRDYLVLEYSYVRSDRLTELMGILRRLREYATERATGVQDIISEQHRAQLTSRLNELFDTHVMCPVGIGSGRGSILHKVHAMLHSFALDLRSWPLVFQACASVVNLTSDQGTESLLQSFPHETVKAEGFLPQFGFLESELQEPAAADAQQAAVLHTSNGCVNHDRHMYATVNVLSVTPSCGTTRAGYGYGP